MKIFPTSIRVLLSLGSAAFCASLMAQDGDDEEIFELSPFTVDVSEDDGYRATSTLAGTRLKTNLNQIGSAITIITEQFMEDVGITNAEELLTFTPNTEVGGSQGNFVGGVIGGRVDQTTARSNPQGNQRVRGLSSAQLTRDYFRSVIPFDRYNTSRITLNRGPNSILFGVGSVAGVINNTTKRAMMNDLPTTFTISLDNDGGHRETLDFNKVLIEDRLAIRLDVMNEDQKYRQVPAFEEDRRFFTAVTAILREGDDGGLLGRTTLRANFEIAESEANPPNPVPPNDGLTNWFSFDNTLPRETYTALGINMPGYIKAESHVPNFTREANGGGWGKTALGWTFYRQLGVTYDGSNGDAPGLGIPGSDLVGGQGSVAAGRQGGNGYNGTSQTTKNIFQHSQYIGFTIPVINNPEIFDYNNYLFTGDTNRRFTDYDVQNIQLEQMLWNGNAGFELAFDNQSYSRESFLPFSGPNGGSVGANDVVIDINSTLNNSDDNGDGVVLNSNVGRPMVRQQGLNRQFGNTDRESMRATSYVMWDARDQFDGWLGALGNHTVNVVYSRETTDTLNYSTALFWGGNFGSGSPYTSGTAWAAGGAGEGSWDRNVVALAYVGEPQFNANSVDDVRLNPIVADLPQNGDVYRMFYRDNATSEILEGDFVAKEQYQYSSMGQSDIKSWSASLHSKFLGDHLIGLLGYRHDQVSVYRDVDFNNDGDDTTWNNLFDPEAGTYTGGFNFAQQRLDPTRDIMGGHSLSWSVVAKFPEGLLGDLPFNSDLNVFYNFSDSFDPTTGRRVNVLGDVLTPPQGETDEFGFMLDMFDRKVSIRANWFKTTESNRSVPGGVGGAVNWSTNGVRDFLNRFVKAEEEGERAFYNPDAPIDPVDGPPDALRRAYARYEQGNLGNFNLPANPNVFVNGDGETVTVNSYDGMYALLGSLIPEPVRSSYNMRYDRAAGEIITEDLGARVATSDSVAEGFEFEITANPIRGLRISGNVAFQETTLSNVAPTLDWLSGEIWDNIQASGLAGLRDTPNGTEGSTYAGRYESRVTAPLAAEQTKEGQVSIEQRNWRANFVGNYSFSKDTALKGFGVVGAVRWQSEIATGYPQHRNENGLVVPILEDAFFDPAIWSGNMWLTYNKKLSNGMDWTVRLNAWNAFGDGNDIPVRRNPDGYLAVFRVAPPTKITLSNTFKF